MSTYTYDGITYRRIGTTSTAEVISVDVGVDGDRSTVIFLDNVLINGVDCTVTTITSTTTEQTFSTIRLPSGLVTIGNDAFYGSNLQYTCDTNGLNIVSTMRFPDTLQSIGDRAFMGSGAGNKYQFATTIFNDGLLQIGDYAFTGATTNNGQLTIPASVTNIGDYAFCEFNDSINPHPVTQLIVNNPLVTNVFLDSFNSLLGSIYIQYYSGSSIKFGTVTSYDELPENWKKISQYYQQVTPSQVPFTIDDNIYYQSINGLTAEALYPVDNTLSSPIIKGSVTINSVVLPVTLIAENCFNGYTSLISLTIPNSVTTIGSYAFYNCSSLTSLTIPNSVTTIGSYAFQNCSSLTSLTIPNSVTTISSYAFSYCISLTSVTIPISTTLIDIAVFYYCSSLTQVIILNPLTCNVNSSSFTDMRNGTSYYGSSITFGTVTSYDELPENWKTISQYYQVVTPSQVPFTIDDNIYYQSINGLTAEALYPVDNTLSSPIIKGSVTINSVVLPVTLIAENCFNGYTSLISLTIPNSVTTIGSYAFYNCSSLTSLTIPNSVTTIGSYAFQNCSSLTSLTIPNSVTTISSYAFSYCISLTSVTIPISTTLIDIAVFYYCSSLTQVIILNPLTCNVNSSSFTDMRNGTSYYGSSITFGTVSSYNELPANWKTISQYYETQNYASPLVCFKEDSKILTSSGYKLIQELKKGDSIKTLKNGYKQVELIGKREMYHVACKDRIKDQLYKCSSDKYPELFEDLIITGCHSILVDNFINDEQKEMVYNLHNRFYVTDEKYRLPIYLDDKSDIYNNSGSHIIYHIALENENYTGNYGIFANGLLVESCSKRYLKELSNMELI